MQFRHRKAQSLDLDRLPRRRPFDEHGEVVVLFLERENEIAILLEPAAALLDLLRVGRVFPEIGRGGAYVEAGQLFFRTGGLKDSSADPQRAC